MKKTIDILKNCIAISRFKKYWVIQDTDKVNHYTSDEEIDKFVIDNFLEVRPPNYKKYEKLIPDTSFSTFVNTNIVDMHISVSLCTDEPMSEISDTMITISTKYSKANVCYLAYRIDTLKLFLLLKENISIDILNKIKDRLESIYDKDTSILLPEDISLFINCKNKNDFSEIELITSLF